MWNVSAWIAVAGSALRLVKIPSRGPGDSGGRVGPPRRRTARFAMSVNCQSAIADVQMHICIHGGHYCMGAMPPRGYWALAGKMGLGRVLGGVEKRTTLPGFLTTKQTNYTK